MGYAPKTDERNSEIVTFFYLIFGHRIHQGMNPDEARKEAYDAVTLRYGIAKGTLLNIISDKNRSRGVNFSALRHNASALIVELEACNKEMGEKKEKNEKLISLLKECLEDG